MHHQLIKNLAYLSEIDLKELFSQMQITQAQLDQLTQDEAGTTQALASFSSSLQTDIQTVTTEYNALQAQIAAAGTPVDTSALDSAIKAATATASGFQATISSALNSTATTIASPSASPATPAS